MGKRAELMEQWQKEVEKARADSERRKREAFVKYFDENHHEVMFLRKALAEIQEAGLMTETQVFKMHSLASKCIAIHSLKCDQLLREANFPPSIILESLNAQELALNGGELLIREKIVMPRDQPRSFAEQFCKLNGFILSEKGTKKEPIVEAYREYIQYSKGFTDYLNEYNEVKANSYSEEAKRIAFNQLLSFVTKNYVAIAKIWEYVCYDTAVLKKTANQGGGAATFETGLTKV